MLLYSEYENGKNKKIKVLGLTIYKSRLLPPKKGIAFYEKKYIKGLFKTKESAQIKKYYILGIKIGQKEKLSFQLDTANNKLKSFISDTVSKILDEQLAVNNLHTKVFPQFKNINKNKEVAIIGTGPTLALYQPIKNVINIGCNRAFQYEKVHFDYIFSTDFNGVKTYIDKLEDYNDCIKFFGSVLDGKEFIAFPQYELDKADYNFYCKLKSNKISPNLETSPLLSSASIAICALHFALYTHPKKIYLVGLDTNQNGNFDNSKPMGTPMAVNFVIDGYKKIKKFADIYYPDVEIISVNPVGLRGIFSDYYQDRKPLEIPFEYDFSDLTNTNINIKGLSFVEKDFRWSCKENVEIDFYIKEICDLNVEFILKPWLNLLKGIEYLDVQIYVNETKIKESRYTAIYSTQECKFTIHKEMINANGHINIRFKFNNMTAPQAFKLNEDYRLLGLMFSKMIVKKV